jgi:hypothetical protein
MKYVKHWKENTHKYNLPGFRTEEKEIYIFTLRKTISILTLMKVLQKLQKYYTLFDSNSCLAKKYQEILPLRFCLLIRGNQLLQILHSKIVKCTFNSAEERENYLQTLKNY